MATPSEVLNRRRAGILLHITSLPSTLGLGSLGKHAYRFVDFLKECDLSVWQMLPIHPLHRVPKKTPHRDFLSPYQPMSVHAGNPMLINLQKLIDRGWLPRMSLPTYSVDQIEKAFEYRRKCLKDAYFHFSRHAVPKDLEEYQKFVKKNRDWLEDYATFCALKEFYQGVCWWKWTNEGHRNHNPDALAKFHQRSKEKKCCIDQYYFEQFAFSTQWDDLKKYATDNGVYLFGDMPHFVARDSVEVWAHREYFLLDEEVTPKFLAGIPEDEDYFCPGEGQCWGYPLYDWDRLKEENFQWWLRRFDTASRLFDMVRLTHFRGFHQCWAIHYTDTDSSPKSRDGEWQPVPGKELFAKFQERNQESNQLLKIVAEDIWASEEVIKLRNQFNFSGMKLLQIAFDLKGEAKMPFLKNFHLPHAHLPRDVVYTGTHDTDTTVGWFESVKEEKEKLDFVCEYLDAKPEKMPWPLIQSAFRSVAKLAVIPMQDILGLDSKCRMNRPGDSKRKLKHNKWWRWQLSDWLQIKFDTGQKLKELVERYERK